MTTLMNRQDGTKRKRRLMALLLAIAMTASVSAQTVNPLAYYTDDNGTEQETTAISDGQAPLAVTFRANPQDMEGYQPSYEWHFRRAKLNEPERELFVRYEENTDYTFNESGTYNIVLKTRLEQDGAELDSVVITINISESRLKFPNAFSPNNDGFNDKYGAYGVNDPESPDHYRSIVEFHAIIINRWGQKLYEWFDPAGSWDGKYNGHPVKEGVYFLQVKAKGADGRDYHIRKDVNLLRGYTEGRNTGGGGE